MICTIWDVTPKILSCSRNYEEGMMNKRGSIHPTHTKSHTTSVVTKFNTKTSGSTCSLCVTLFPSKCPNFYDFHVTKVMQYNRWCAAIQNFYYSWIKELCLVRKKFYCDISSLQTHNIKGINQRVGWILLQYSSKEW